jgi:DNA-binding transcriptional MerR regulator
VGQELRLDDLAREAGVASTTVRLYRTKGLLAPPRMEGRTGWYDGSHLARLRLIARLQDQGHSLAGISRLLDTWQQGRGLDEVVGVEEQLDALLHQRAVVLSPEELANRFPAGALTQDLVVRAGRLGLIAFTDDGNVRVADVRFLDTGAALIELGIPADVVLDEWEALTAATDEIATRFIGLFESHLLPDDWRVDLDDRRTRELATTLVQLKHTAAQVLIAALDSSIATIGTQRVAELVEPAATGASSPR